MAANTAAHSQIMSVLNGSSVVVTSNSEVALNLAPLITAVLKDISGPLSRLTGKTITPPAISAVPATACRQIASLARTRLPADCGQIPLFPASALTHARLAFRILSAGTLALVILAPSAGTAALLAAPHRRRALLQMTIGGGLTVLATSIAVTLLQSSLITRAQPRYQPVVTAILHALTSGYFILALWCMISSLILAAAALLSGSELLGHRSQEQNPPGRHAATTGSWPTAANWPTAQSTRRGHFRSQNPKQSRPNPLSGAPQHWPRPISCQSSDRALAAMTVTIP